MNISLTEYVGKMIKKMKRFAKQFGCLRDRGRASDQAGPGHDPGSVHISDSAHWANKAGSRHRGPRWRRREPSARQIIIPKVRLKRIAGNTGTVPLAFDEVTGLFVKPDF